MTVMVPRKNWKDFWDGKWESRDRSIRSGIATVTVTGPHYGHHVHVTSPLNNDFRLGARSLGGTWRSRSGVWTFPPNSHDKVWALCVDVYGETNVRTVGWSPYTPAAPRDVSWEDILRDIDSGIGVAQARIKKLRKAKAVIENKIKEMEKSK